MSRSKQFFDGLGVGFFQHQKIFSGGSFDHLTGSGIFICPKKSYPFLDFMDLLVEQFRFPNFQIKQIWAGLVSNLQQITEPPGNQKQGPCSFAFQQGVGGDGGSHPDPFDQIRVKSFRIKRLTGYILKNPAYSLSGSVVIIVGIF